MCSPPDVISHRVRPHSSPLSSPSSGIHGSSLHSTVHPPRVKPMGPGLLLVFFVLFFPPLLCMRVCVCVRVCVGAVMCLWLFIPHLRIDSVFHDPSHHWFAFTCVLIMILMMIIANLIVHHCSWIEINFRVLQGWKLWRATTGYLFLLHLLGGRGLCVCGNHPPVSSSVWLCNCQLVGNYVLAMVVCCVKLAIKALKRKKEEEEKKKKRKKMVPLS